MKLPPLRHVLFAAAAAPLALGLAACKKSGESGASGAPVAAVAAPAGKAWSDVVASTTDGGTVMGNPNAPIKLVEYGSLSCPHCAHLAEEGMQPLVANYVNTGKVSYEYRSFAIHSIDIPLTVLVRCAPREAFFPLVEQLYANQPALLDRAEKGNDKAKAAAALPPAQRMVALSDAFGFTDFFSARGISVDQAHKCLGDISAAETVAKAAQTYGDKGIDATPTLFINGNKLTGATWPELEAGLKAAGAR